MFLGTFEHTVDAKGRMFLPAKFRSDLLGKIYLTRVIDRPALALYPQGQWLAYVEKIEALPQLEMRAVRRFIFENSAEPELDIQGRLLIPADLRSYAKLEKNVKVTGNNTFIEIWSETEHNAMEAEFADREKIINTLIGLGF